MVDIITQVDTTITDIIGTIINTKWGTFPTLKHLLLALSPNNYILGKISYFITGYLTYGY